MTIVLVKFTNEQMFLVFLPNEPELWSLSSCDNFIYTYWIQAGQSHSYLSQSRLNLGKHVMSYQHIYWF